MTTRPEEMTSAVDVGRLVECAAAGDGRAWERLVGQYDRLICAASGGFMPGDAADVRQATRLRLLAQLYRHEHPQLGGAGRGGPGAGCDQPVRDGLSGLPWRWQQLLAVLIAPQVPASH